METRYKAVKSGDIKLVDDSGFRPALRSTIVDLAIERVTLGTPGMPSVENEEDGEA